MTNRSVQKFPSGETRVFEWAEGEEPKITGFTRAPGDKRTANMIGKPESELPPPFEATAGNE
ncbi:MAG: hypothetical protein ACK4KX_03170 [Parvibaculum sp.]|uniref:hypothetical protein n=1 Tax=Parvibaculum sp. TaxID=2024848 RepID=UPI00391BA1B4